LAGPGEPNRAHQLRENVLAKKKAKLARLATCVLSRPYAAPYEFFMKNLKTLHFRDVREFRDMA
jgi:hypothetical protein